MEPPEKFILRWEHFGANTKVALKELREESEFFDVTLVAGDGKRVEASKVVLAAGSSFFHKILRENPHPRPLIYLKGVEYKHLLSLLDFLYTGETSIAEENLKQFLEIAGDLEIKGLTASSLDPHQNQMAVEKSSVEGHPHSAVSPLEDQIAAVEPEDADLPSPREGQVAAETADLSHGFSHSHSVRSPPREGQVAEEAGLSHGISHSQMTFSLPQDPKAIEEIVEVKEQQSSTESRVPDSQSFASSNGQNSVPPQSACDEDHSGSCHVKVEENNNDNELDTKWRGNEQKVEILYSSSDIVISKETDSIFENNPLVQDLYGRDERIELDIRNADVKEEGMDSTLNTENAVVKDNSEILDIGFIENSLVKNVVQKNADDPNDSTKPTLKKNGENSIYEVTCKETRGEFHQEKFISGCKGLCILSYGRWMTPNEFEIMAGSRAKKYKQSLKVNGKPISKLIDPNGNRPTTPAVQINSTGMGNKQYNKENMKSIKMKLDKMYESVGASSTLDKNQDEFLNTGDDITTSDEEIDLSGTPITLALQDNSTNLDESYVMKDGMDENYTEDAVLIDLDNIDNYRSPIGSKTRIKHVIDNDVPEIVDLGQLEKEKNRSSESTDVNQFETPKLDEKCPKPDVKRDNARFSDSQTLDLVTAFNEDNFLSKEKAQLLSQELCLTEKQVKIWFNNSRAKKRKLIMKKMLGEIRKYSCESCSRYFVNKSNFTKHMSSHDSGTFLKDN